MFSDSHRFEFIEMDSGLIPVHRRPLGEKEGHLYSKKVTWADVTINGVELEKTFMYEDTIDYIEQTKDLSQDFERGVVIVNERSNNPTYDEDYDIDEKLVRRLKNMKIAPLTFKQAKKKKPSKNKRTSKPPTKVEKEKHETFAETFQEIVDKKDHGIHEDFQLKVVPKESDMKAMFYGIKTFSPPIDWIEPVKRWDLIWSHIDTIEKGYKRNYKYTKPGVTDENGVLGPAIYFYDKNDTDLNYSFNWKEDFIFSEVEYGGNGEFLFYNEHTFDPEKANYVSCAPRFNMPPDFKRQPWGGYYYDEYNVVLERSNSSRLRECEKEYLEYPCEETYDRYNSQWSKWPGGNIWYRDLGQAPWPHV